MGEKPFPFDRFIKPDEGNRGACERPSLEIGTHQSHTDEHSCLTTTHGEKQPKCNEIGED
jgi:hypothetical protein